MIATMEPRKPLSTLSPRAPAHSTKQNARVKANGGKASRRGRAGGNGIGAQEFLVDRERLRAHALLVEVRAHMLLGDIAKDEPLLWDKRQCVGNG